MMAKRKEQKVEKGVFEYCFLQQEQRTIRSDPKTPKRKCIYLSTFIDGSGCCDVGRVEGTFHACFLARFLWNSEKRSTER